MCGNLRFITIFDNNVLLPYQSDLSAQYFNHFSTSNVKHYGDFSDEISREAIAFKNDFLNDQNTLVILSP